MNPPFKDAFCTCDSCVGIIVFYIWSSLWCCLAFSWSTGWSRNTDSVARWRRAGGNWRVTADPHRAVWERWRRPGLGWRRSSKGQRHAHLCLVFTAYKAGSLSACKINLGTVRNQQKGCWILLLTYFKELLVVGLLRFLPFFFGFFEAYIVIILWNALTCNQSWSDKKRQTNLLLSLRLKGTHHKHFREYSFMPTVI